MTLLLVAGCLVGCQSSNSKPKAGSTVTVKPKPAAVETNAPITADGLPAEHSWLSHAQIVELKKRLDRLTVGMPRTQVLQILDIPSFNVRYFEHVNSTGLTIQIRNEHTLSLGFKEADYDPVFRWAKFDQEVWPQPSKQPLSVRILTNSPPIDKTIVPPHEL
jgi:hypothetical protein